MTHDVLLCTVTRLFCYPKPLLHPGLSRKGGGRSSVLSGVIRLISEPPRTEYSGEPEMSRFLVRPKACHEKFRTVRAHKQKKKSRKNQIKRFFLLFCVCFFQKCYSQNPLPGISLRWQSFDILTLSHSPANLSDFWLFIFFNSLCQLIGTGSVFSPAEVSL